MGSNFLAFLFALMRTNLKATVALRAAFWTNVIAMLLNNLLFFTMWWIFFEQFQEIRGWKLGDMAVLFGVVSAGWGVASVFAAGTGELARCIRDGELDAYLCQPKPALVHVIASHTRASGWGDILSGIVLLTISGYMSLATLPLAALAVLISAVLFTASGVLIHCLAFWLSGFESVARQVQEFLITFSIYPRTIFEGGLKFILFTIVPAGFIGYLPAELVQSFSVQTLLMALGGVVFYVGLAVWMFERGLRHYASGSRFVVGA